MARRKSDAEVGPLGVWAYNTRDRLDVSVEEVIAALPTTYHPATLRKVEGGSAQPGSRMWRELGELYGRLAAERTIVLEPQPRLRPAAANDDPIGMADLVRAINDLVTEMRLARERDQDAAAAMVRAAEALLSAQRPGGASASTSPDAPLATGR